MKKLIGVLTLHLFCLVLLVLPDNLQGPVVFNSSGIDFRALDITAIILIIFGSTYLFTGVMNQFKTDKKVLQELFTKKKDDKKTGE